MGNPVVRCTITAKLQEDSGSPEGYSEVKVKSKLKQIARDI